SLLEGEPGLKQLRGQLLARPQAFYERLTREYSRAGQGSERARLRLAQGHRSLGHIDWILGRNEQASRHFEAARALYRGRLAASPDCTEYLAGLAKSEQGAGIVLNATDRQREAAGAFERSVALFERVAARRGDDPDPQAWLAVSLTHLGLVYAALGRHREAA